MHQEDLVRVEKTIIPLAATDLVFRYIFTCITYSVYFTGVFVLKSHIKIQSAEVIVLHKVIIYFSKDLDQSGCHCHEVFGWSDEKCHGQSRHEVGQYQDIWLHESFLQIRKMLFDYTSHFLQIIYHILSHIRPTHSSVVVNCTFWTHWLFWESQGFGGKLAKTSPQRGTLYWLKAKFFFAVHIPSPLTLQFFLMYCQCHSFQTDQWSRDGVSTLWAVHSYTSVAQAKLKRLDHVM